MPLTLLPRSAAAFAPRAPPTVVLPPTVEKWLTETLRRVTTRRPLNNSKQHQQCLVETLSGKRAIWSLASIMVHLTPEGHVSQDALPQVEAFSNCEMMHLQGYCVHIDMVSQHEVAFKLTQDTISALIDYHKTTFLPQSAAATGMDWPEKEAQTQKLQETFVQSINSYVYRTDEKALQGMEDEGSGELLEGRCAQVKSAIMGLFTPLTRPPTPPPPPTPSSGVFGMIGSIPFMTISPVDAQQWWPVQAVPVIPSQAQTMTSADTWQHMLGSSPSPLSTQSISWSPVGQQETHLASPASSYTQSYSTPSNHCSPPTSMSTIPNACMTGTFTPHCGTFASPEFANCGWTYNDMMTQYPIQI